MANEVTLYNPEKNKEVVNGMNAVIQQCVPIAEKIVLDMALQFQWANGIKQMRSYLETPEIKELVTGLQDSQLGFLTDSDKTKGEKYPYNVVAECCTYALLHGYRLIGNEFNIISGKCYLAKDGLFRKIIEHVGLSDFTPITSTPVFTIEKRTDWYGKPKEEPMAEVQCWAKWKIDGKPQSIGYDGTNLIFKIKAKGATDDNITGKALRRLYVRVLAKLKGQTISDAEPDEPVFTSQAQAASVSVSDISQPVSADDPDAVIKAFEANHPDIFTALKEANFSEVPTAPAKRKLFAQQLKEKLAAASAQSDVAPASTETPTPAAETDTMTEAEARQIIAEYPEAIRFDAISEVFPEISDKTKTPQKPENMIKLAIRMKAMKAGQREPGMEG